MSNNQETRGIAQFALFGAIGFGIGGIITGFGWGISEVMLGIGFSLTGALGGASLGLALKRKIILLSALGAVGFLVVFLFSFFTRWFAYENLVSTILLVAIIPYLIGGILLGAALWNWKAIICLSLTGCFGFFIGMILFMMIGWLTSVGALIPGFIGVLGYLEKRGKLIEAE
jgi:hypothetical protein